MFNSSNQNVISSGYSELDNILGIGGIPRGRIIELSGPEDSMKTTFVLHMLANMQKQNIFPAYIDVDNDLTSFHMINAGIDTKMISLSYLNTDVAIIDHVREIVSIGVVDVIVIDSTGLINPEKDRKITGMFRDMLSKLSSIVYGTNTTILFINQLRSKCDKEKTSVPLCDQAFSAYASIRIKINKVNEENDTVVIKVTRNKLWHKLDGVTLNLR
jgi:recombination protein RecA